jgi:SulP family sulfate permease
LTIVTLAQSISIAKAVAERSGQAIDANREFRGQGLSNLVGASPRRTCPAARSTARCRTTRPARARRSRGVRLGWLLLLVALMAPLLGLIPLAAIAGLLLLIAWSLFDCPAGAACWRFSRRDFAIAAATFVATVTIRSRSRSCSARSCRCSAICTAPRSPRSR